ncbi:trypsin-like peptidase domain-containing protein, partial [Clavibacter michiganensis]|uniref:trypsin-like peptidase domain-containing protein n=1 Tax=Clavibacter michiganensis TaxID=28447 RepID=UPI002931C716
SVKRDPGTVAGVAAKALPSTVTIQAESSAGEGGTGTGFVFDTEGHIVTNNHVVADAVDGGKLTATFPNGKRYDAEVVGHAQGYDVAVIKLKSAPSDLKPLTLGDSDKVAVGDSVLVSGTVSEYVPGRASSGNQSLTEITKPVITVVSSGNAVPDARVIDSKSVPAAYSPEGDTAAGGSVNGLTLEPGKYALDY